MIYQLVMTHFALDASATDQASLGIRVLILIVASLLGGVLASKCVDFALCIITPFLGAYMAVASLDHFAYVYGLIHHAILALDPDADFFGQPAHFQKKCSQAGLTCYGLIFAWALLCGVGIMYQCGYRSKYRYIEKEY